MLTRDEFYREWIRALRSGEYVQGRGALRKDDSFCCLGVVCDIAVKHGRGLWVAPPNDRTLSIGYKDTPSSGVVSGMLPHWLASLLELENSALVQPLDMGRLAKENDSTEWTFSEIADVLELYACSIGVAL